MLEKERLLPRYLSVGERQRVGIARAVVNRPKVLLADEPTGNLDPALSASVMALFRQFHNVGTTVIVASHDLELIGGDGRAHCGVGQGQSGGGQRPAERAPPLAAVAAAMPPSLVADNRRVG